jgi:hypothetical protein
MRADTPHDPERASGIDPDGDIGVPAQRRELAGHPLDVLGASPVAAGLGMAVPAWWAARALVS